MTTYTIQTAPSSIDDQLVTSQLPADVVASLGDWEGSGFNLDTGKRDVGYSNGCVVYAPGSNQVDVHVGTDDDIEDKIFGDLVANMAEAMIQQGCPLTTPFALLEGKTLGDVLSDAGILDELIAEGIVTA